MYSINIQNHKAINCCC